MISSKEAEKDLSKQLSQMLSQEEEPVVKKRKGFISTENLSEKQKERILKNRQAANASREKKRKYMEMVEEQNALLKQENEELRKRMRLLEEKNAQLEQKVQELSDKVSSSFQNPLVSTTNPNDISFTTSDFNFLNNLEFTNQQQASPSSTAAGKKVIGNNNTQQMWLPVYSKILSKIWIIFLIALAQLNGVALPHEISYLKRQFEVLKRRKFLRVSQVKEIQLILFGFIQKYKSKKYHYPP